MAVAKAPDAQLRSAEPYARANWATLASDASPKRLDTPSVVPFSSDDVIIAAGLPIPNSSTAWTQPSQEAIETRVPEPVVLVPDPTPLDYSFDMRAQWEGVVVEIGKDEFTVVLRDILHPGASENDAVLPKEEVAEDDLPLLQAGAVFYWTIGYEQTRSGTRKRTSTLRFRRLPAWSRKDIERAEQQARALDDIFRTE